MSKCRAEDHRDPRQKQGNLREGERSHRQGVNFKRRHGECAAEPLKVYAAPDSTLKFHKPKTKAGNQGFEIETTEKLKSLGVGDVEWSIKPGVELGHITSTF